MHSHSHTIIRLPVHLPLQQPVYFQPGDEEEALANASGRDTMLTAWFKLNTTDVDANAHLYLQVPNHYVFHQSSRQWKPRKIGGDKVIARMYVVSPNDQERFYLRLLLLHVPGATSFEHLRTVDGEVMPTFKDACLRRHLLADDADFDNTIAEASVFSMPYQLRQLFATLCAFAHPPDPLQLWLNHKANLLEDYMLHYPEDEAVILALLDIDNILNQCGKCCTKQTSTVSA